jgi:hypothetical protein
VRFLAGLSGEGELPLSRLWRFAQRFRSYQNAKSAVTNTSWFTPTNASIPAPLAIRKRVVDFWEGYRTSSLVIVDFYLHRLQSLEGKSG